MRGGCFRWLALHFVAFVILSGQQLHAQLADSTVHVRVAEVNAGGKRALVSLTRTGDTESPHRTPVDANGEATFAHISPGWYRLTVDHPEFAAINQPIEVRSGEVLILTVRSASSAASSNRSTVDITRHHFSSGTVFNDIRLRDLPNSNSVWPLIETSDPMSFTDRMDTAGLSAGDPAVIGSYAASSWTQASFYMDGVDVTDVTRGGTPFIYPDLDAFTAVNVATAGTPVEVGSPGPAVTLVPRRPTAAWSGEIATDWTPGAGVRAPDPSEPPAIANVTSWNRGHLLVSGPLVKDRVGLLLSGNMIRSGHQERYSPVVLPGDVNSIFAHVVVTPDRPYEFRFILAGQRLIRAFPGRARFQDDNAAEHDGRFQLQGTWEGHSGARVPWRISAAYDRASITPRLSGLGPAPAIERLLDGPVPELVSSTAGSRERWTTSAAFEPRIERLGPAHELRYGATLSGTQATARPDPGGLIPELVGGVPARVWDYHYAGPLSRWRETMVSGYAADRFIPSRFIAIEGGLRFEALSGKANGAPAGVSWAGLSPRVSLRWKPLGSERATIVSSYGRYRWQVPLVNLSFGDPTAARGTVYRWLDTNKDGIFQTSEFGPLIARVGPGSVNGDTTIDPELRRPYTDTFLIGIETRRTDAFMMRFAATFSRDHRLMASVNVGVPLSAYTIGHVPDPGGNLGGTEDDQLLPYYNRNPASFGQDRELLTNPAEPAAKFHGMELIVERTFVKRFQMLLGATATGSDTPGANRGFHVFENDQGVIGERLTNPNADTFARNRQFFERGYAIKVSGSYHAPRDWRMGVTARYQDGQPFSRIVIVPELNQGAEPVQAYRNGRTRFTYALTVDARVEKRVTVGAINFGAVFEAYNLLNTKNEVEEDILTGPNFRATTAVQPPRAFRVGLRLGL